MLKQASSKSLGIYLETRSQTGIQDVVLERNYDYIYYWNYIFRLWVASRLRAIIGDGGAIGIEK